MYKLSNIIKFISSVKYKYNIRSNKRFSVRMENQISKPKEFSIGLPQGLVQAPVLFNILIRDILNTKSYRFGYIDDLSIVMTKKFYNTMYNIISLTILHSKNVFLLKINVESDISYKDVIINIFMKLQDVCVMWVRLVFWARRTIHAN